MDVRADDGFWAGRHYETGTLRNAWAAAGAVAPHTGQPYSEALLLGVSGGITFGYFTFAYGGELPHLALLTRNTFDPFETILDRLAPPREVRQTADPAKAERQLNAALEAGAAPLVWADVYSLPYYQMGPSQSMWMMRPMVVVGRAGDDYLVADGARRPWRVSAAALSAARGRVKKERFRLMTLEPPNPARLAGAVLAGLRQCVSLFTEAPPKGAKDNFGFAAYEKWAKMLVNTKHQQSWARLFPRGPALFQALGGSLQHPGLLGWVMTWTTGEDADRRVFADFLDEAALILGRPGLRDAGQRFRAAADLWHQLARQALPDEVPLLKEARELMLRRRALFSEGGESVAPERAAIRERLEAIRVAVAVEFPQGEAETNALLSELSEQVVAISRIEREALEKISAGV